MDNRVHVSTIVQGNSKLNRLSNILFIIDPAQLRQISSITSSYAVTAQVIITLPAILQHELNNKLNKVRHTERGT